MADPAEETAPRGTTQEWVPVALREVGGPNRPTTALDRSVTVEYSPPPPEDAEPSAYTPSSEASQRVSRLAGEVKRIAGEVGSRVDGVEAVLASAVTELNHRIAALEERIAAAEQRQPEADARQTERLDSLERGLEGLGASVDRYRAEAAQVTPKAPPPPPPNVTAAEFAPPAESPPQPPKPPRVVVPDGQTAPIPSVDALDINRVTFEELRGLGLGLSVTQASRLLAFRTEQGGFRSLDQLDGIPGMPDSMRDDLRTRLRVGP